MAQDYHKTIKVKEHDKVEHARYNHLSCCSEWL